MIFLLAVHKTDKLRSQKLCFQDFLKTQDDREVFAALYQKYHTDVFKMVFKLCQNEADAQDIMQETWIGIINHMHDLEGKDDAVVRSFIMRAAYYHIKHLQRVQSKERGFISYDEEEFEMMDDIDLFEQCDTSGYDDVVKCLKLLSEEQRDILTLHYLSQLSLKEIAKLLNLSESAVKSRWFRGRQRLIELLKERGYGYDK